MAVGLLQIRVHDVERTDEGKGFIVYGPRHRIDIRHEPVPEPEEVAGDPHSFSTIRPGHARVPFPGILVGGMETEERAEDSELQPPGIEVKADVPSDEPADVVRDIGDEYV